MKKLLLIFFIVAVWSCKEDELLEQPAVTFYPKVSLTAPEGGDTDFEILVETSGVVEGGGSVFIELVNGEDLITTPAAVNGVIELPFADGTSTNSILLRAGNENRGGDYTAQLIMTKVTGGIRSIATGAFTVFVLDNDREVIFEDNFESQNLSKWTAIDVKGTNGWETRTFAENYYAVVSNFNNEGDPTEDWLITPEIDFDFYQSERLTFMTQTAFNDENILEVVVLTNYAGDPAAATVTKLSPELDPHRGGGFGDFTSSGIVDLGSVTGKGHVAFHFTAIDESDGTQWQVDDVEISGINPNGAEEFLNLPFSEDFEACENNGKPSTFNEVFVPGAKTDRGWLCRTGKGASGSVSVRANAFGGVDGEANAWLVSSQRFKLSDVSAASLEFDYRSESSGNGNITVQWSEDFSGNISAATWNALSDIVDQLPEKGSNTFQTITSDLSAAVGKNVYLAFQFSGAQFDNSASFDIDNIMVKASGGGGGSGSDAIDISEARGKDGETVTITGIVTTPDFGFNNGEFYVQDGTAGLKIFYPDNFGAVALGDEVTVTGPVGERFAQVRIEASDVSVVSNGNTLPDAVSIEVSALTADSNLQGSRVVIDGVTLDDPSSWPVDAISTSSGLTVNATAGGSPVLIRIDRGESFYDGSTTPSGEFKLRGILTRFNEDAQIMPFIDGDIE